MSRSATFFVPGIPVPKGSTHSFKHATTGNVVTVQSNRAKQKPWAALIGLAAKGHWPGAPTRAAVEVVMTYSFTRPKGHYGTGRNAGTLKRSAPQYMTVAPDVDKLERCVLDALTGIIYMDDKQVVQVTHGKIYDAAPGLHISVREAAQEGDDE